MSDPSSLTSGPSYPPQATHQYGQAPTYPAPHVQAMAVHSHPGGQGGPVASGLMFKKRNPVMTWLVFPLITLGIYQLVWYYKINKEMAEFDRRRQVPVAGPALVMFFLGWTGIALLISYYNTGQRIQNAQRAAGLAPTCSPAVSCVLAIVFGLSTFYMQSELNKIVEHYGSAPEGAVVPLFV